MAELPLPGVDSASCYAELAGKVGDRGTGAVEFGEEEDAQPIVETLNARGTPLLPSDLVKNHVLAAEVLSTTPSSPPGRQMRARADLSKL